MTTAQTVQTVIEIIAVVALLVGFMYEPIIAEWERKQGEKMLKAFNKRKEYRK